MSKALEEPGRSTWNTGEIRTKLGQSASVNLKLRFSLEGGSRNSASLLELISFLGVPQTYGISKLSTLISFTSKDRQPPLTGSDPSILPLLLSLFLPHINCSSYFIQGFLPSTLYALLLPYGPALIWVRGPSDHCVCDTHTIWTSSDLGRTQTHLSSSLRIIYNQLLSNFIARVSCVFRKMVRARTLEESYFQSPLLFWKHLFIICTINEVCCCHGGFFTLWQATILTVWLNCGY